MTPKEAYEARKAARKTLREQSIRIQKTHDERDAEMVEFIDRFVTAVERIADALEGKADD